MDIQFENPFAVSLQSSAPSSLFDNRAIVSILGSKDISNTGLESGAYKMKFSMNIDDNDPQSLHNYSEVVISLAYDEANPSFTDSTSLAQAITGLLVQAYTATGDILNSSELPIVVVADGNKVKFSTKNIGSHRLTIADSNDVGSVGVYSLANLIGVGDIPADSVGSEYTITGNTLNFYQSLFTVYSKATPEATQVTQTANITMNPITHDTMQKVLDKLNEDFESANVDATASFIVSGNLIIGIRLSTKYTGVGNNVVVKPVTSGSYQPLFAVASNTNGIDVNNTEDQNGNLTGSTEGTVGSGQIDKYVDRLAVAIKKHILNGMASSVGGIS